MIETTFEDNLLLVTLNRPEKRNALTLEMLQLLASAVEQADSHPEVRAIILSGAGPVFSAGVDLMGLMQARMEAGAQNPARWLRRLAGEMQRCLNTLEETEVPVIAALQGRVIGLGLELALACDLRVAADDLRLSIPEARLGLVADVGGTTRLTRLIGPGRAKDMLMTAREVGAQEALSWGLINRTVPANELRESAIALAQQIAQNAPLAVGLAKLIVDQGHGMDKHSQMAIERWAQSQLITTGDLAEAMAAFAEKRPPTFSGL